MRIPAASARRRERLEILTRHIRPFTLECLRGGEISQGWNVYRKTFAWHLALGRASYLSSRFRCSRQSTRMKRRKATAA